MGHARLFLQRTAQVYRSKGGGLGQGTGSSQGRYIVLAGLGDGMNGVLEFWDADTQTMMSKEQEHYRCSHVSAMLGAVSLFSMIPVISSSIA